MIVPDRADYAAIYAGSGDRYTDRMRSRCAKAAAILSLAAIAYCSIFGAISLLTKRTLIVGILYTAIVEGLLASLAVESAAGERSFITRG